MVLHSKCQVLLLFERSEQILGSVAQTANTQTRTSSNQTRHTFRATRRSKIVDSRGHHVDVGVEISRISSERTMNTVNPKRSPSKLCSWPRPIGGAAWLRPFPSRPSTLTYRHGCTKSRSLPTQRSFGRPGPLCLPWYLGQSWRQVKDSHSAIRHRLSRARWAPNDCRRVE